MSNAFIKLEEQLAAAQAEVARLHESASALREMDSQCDAYATQAVVLTRERDEARASFHAAGVEIAALRREAAFALDLLRRPKNLHSNGEAAIAALVRALSAPSAAEPLLADIRAAVEAMDALIDRPCLDREFSAGCRVCEGRAALTGLRRWVP